MNIKTKGKGCSHGDSCQKCAGKHQKKKCENTNDKKCRNCIYSNGTYNTNYKTDHLTTDSQECQMLETE